MNILCLDVETTIFQKGNSHSQANRMVVGGYLFNGVYREYYLDDLSSHVIIWMISNCDLLITFAGKFDLNWLRRSHGIQYHKQIWDVQLAHFIITNQEEPYPSLNSVCEYYGLGQKEDAVKTFWDQGIGTEAIPRPILSGYLEQDVRLTYECYLKQKDCAQKRLILQSGWDMLTLAEMEFNGMQYDCEASLAEAEIVQAQIDDMDKMLAEEVECEINWSSPTQVSKVLYGGVISLKTTESYLLHYKDDKKLPVTKVRTVKHDISFPRLVNPLKSHGDESYSIDEGTLKKLKPTGKAKRIIVIIQERAKLAKTIGTYLRGMPKKNSDYGWPENMIHGSFNSCVAVTGRLSSSAPNLQNVDSVVKPFFTTRFA